MLYIAIASLVISIAVLIIVIISMTSAKKTADSAIDETIQILSKEIYNSKTESSSQVDRLRDSFTMQFHGIKEDNASIQTSVRNKLDERLDKMQADLNAALMRMMQSNEAKLDEMRRTVDEKLDKTLETRLQKSFETVSQQLESVYRGLGEMKTFSEEVDTLKKVLSNTKARGILGELQLGQIVSDILPEQLYEREFSTIPGSKDRVEFAIKLPGSGENGHVYLPIDSKFPLEDYYKLLDAYDTADTDAIETQRKALKQRVKQFAKDVVTKYIAVPYTTTFAILFLPTEGLYSEIVRDAAFFDTLRKDGVIIAGPTTLSAILNSLQVGFKTLQIQKGAAEIEKTLGIVKSEFEKFEDILVKVYNRIQTAGGEIDELIGRRTRAINRSLREIQTYSGEDATKLLDE